MPLEVVMNLVMLSGHLSSDPTVRELQSGSVLMTFELTTKVDETSVSVPLVWFDPPKKINVNAGDEVTAVGSVRRRFYRAGGATQSRTEVVVVQLGRVTDKRSLAAQEKWVSAVMEGSPLEGVISS
jgi:single-strand DNA-binding protein